MRVDVPWSRQADIAARTTVSVVTEYVDAGASGGWKQATPQQTGRTVSRSTGVFAAGGASVVDDAQTELAKGLTRVVKIIFRQWFFDNPDCKLKLQMSFDISNVKLNVSHAFLILS